MRVTHDIDGNKFEWDEHKASANFKKHRISFGDACQVLLDPFMQIVDASDKGEVRAGAIGHTFHTRLLFVVHVERDDDVIRIISARKAEPEERAIYEEG